MNIHFANRFQIAAVGKWATPQASRFAYYERVKIIMAGVDAADGVESQFNNR